MKRKNIYFILFVSASIIKWLFWLFVDQKNDFGNLIDMIADISINIIPLAGFIDWQMEK